MDTSPNEEWAVKSNKRNLSSSSASESINSPKTPSQPIKKKIFASRNRFEVFSQPDNNEDIQNPTNITNNIDQSNTVSYIKSPPPIFVKGVQDFPGLCTSLIEILGVDNFICKSSTDRLKIQTSTPDTYRTLIHFLKNQNAEYHTYQLQQDKPLRVVIRNLHPSTQTSLIKSELELREFEVRNVTNVLHKVHKHPLPLFFVDLEPSPQSNDIYKLTSMLHTKIKVEEPYKPKIISQCLNCQEYGHTKSYCNYSSRCVRCGDQHQSSDCTVSRENPPKCALCQGNHPASYRGCAVYKEIQRRKNPSPNNAFLYDKSRFKKHNVQTSHPENDAPPINTRTYAQATSGQRTTHPSPSSESNINNPMTLFLEEFKSLINPLIALLTKVVSSLLHKANHPDNTAHGGVAILVKYSIIYQSLPNVCEDIFQSCAIQIHANNVPITVAVIYSPPKHNVSYEHFSNYFNTINNNFIIGGDYNAKHQSWGCRVNNPRGNILYNFVNSKKYKVLAPPGPTYWPSSPHKNPDILDIFITKTPSNLHYVIDNILDLNSDHSSVILTLNDYPSSIIEPLKLFHTTTDRYKFHDLVNQNLHLNIRLKSNDDIDVAVNNLTNVIQSAAWAANTTKNVQNSNSNSLSTNIRILISEKRRARALYQRTRLPSHKKIYNKLGNHLKKVLAKIKNLSYENFLTKLSAKNGSLWKASKQALHFKITTPPIKKSDGSFAVSDTEKAELFKNHLFNIFQPHQDILPANSNTVLRSLDMPLPPSPPVKYFSPSDIKFAIQKQTLRKSPGFDLITAEVARCLPKRAIVLLTNIFNAILRLSYFPLLWKFSKIILFPKPNKPPDLVTSYRPISLLPFFAKVLERLILNRLLPIISEKNILPNYQFGFRAQYSTIHQAHRLVDSISFALEKKMYCSCVFLDIQQAFDRVWHEGLLYKIKTFLPQTYYTLLKSYLTDRFFQVSFKSAYSNITNIRAGVPQGGILSPILYNLYASDQPTSANTTVADYADDKLIISINENPIVASLNLQHHLSLMEIWYKNWRFKVNQTKSHHTTFTLKLGHCPPVTLYGTQIPMTSKVKYLGLTLDRRLTWAQHTRVKRLQLNLRLRMLKSLLVNNKHTNLNVKLLMYKSLIKPIWTYGLQLWGNAKKSNTNRIQTFQNIALRKLTNSPPYISNRTLHVDLKIKSVKEEAVTYYKRFYNRLSSHPNPLIKALSANTIPGNPPRRLKRNWCRDMLT
ncbi:hypothetical protein QTP88_022788 [Uroleucon formosanum]